ncbi:MAG: zf-HC2 domain-containing protein [Candidatus Poribacteria bacterium]|nr:zf-HC2 domain-containing protein [Candidatus Poribacteria bacterium]
MNCLQVEENFSAHYEDLLDYETLQRFESHMTECEACQQEYTQFRESVNASQQLPQVVPSSLFLSTLQQRLSEEQREKITFWQRLQLLINTPKLAFGVVMILILATAGTFIYQNDLFNSDIQSNGGVDYITTSDSQSPLDNNDLLQPRGFNSVDPITIFQSQPMQQHYILKQVSYTAASTAGGL